MAISSEDKADVKKAMGKAMANKIEKVTHDKFKAPGHKRRLTNRTITDDASGRTVQFSGRANYHPRASSSTGKMYTSPTGSRHRIGSQKHRYWEMIKRIGKDAPNGEHSL